MTIITADLLVSRVESPLPFLESFCLARFLHALGIRIFYGKAFADSPPIPQRKNRPRTEKGRASATHGVGEAEALSSSARISCG